jgi:hypothetical protein
MAFPVGHFHWISSLIVLGYLAYNRFKHKKIDELGVFLLLFIGVGWISTFMCHSRSTFIWQHVKVLSMIQFPWRFLAIPTFTFSFVAGALVLILSKFKKILPYLVAVLLVGLVVWNWNFFKVERFGPVTDAEKFSGEAWRLQQTAGIYDYLPVTAEMAPQAPRKSLVDIISGQAISSNEKQGTDWATFTVDVSSEMAEVRVGILDFPYWKAYIDGKETNIYVPDDEKWGRIYIDVPTGQHEVSLKLANTPIRIITNLISLLTAIGLLTYLLIGNKVLQFKRG